MRRCGDIFRSFLVGAHLWVNRGPYLLGHKPPKVSYGLVEALTRAPLGDGSLANPQHTSYIEGPCIHASSDADTEALLGRGGRKKNLHLFALTYFPTHSHRMVTLSRMSYFGRAKRLPRQQHKSPKMCRQWMVRTLPEHWARIHSGMSPVGTGTCLALSDRTSLGTNCDGPGSIGG